MKRRLLSMIIALFLLVPTLASCGGDEKNSGNEKGSVNTVGETAGEYAYIDEYVDDLAKEYNFDGSTFIMIDNGTAFPKEDQITGVLEDDALYNRYRELEEKFGVTMELLARDDEGTDFQTPGEVIADDVKRDIMAGGSTYDLISGSLVNCGQPLVNYGVVRPVNDIPAIDLSRSWWVQNLDKQVGFGEYIYSIFGKAQYSHYTTPGLMIFSKSIKEDYGIKDDFYQIVQDGDWTVDRMVEIAASVPVNTSATYEGTYKYYFSSGYAWYAAAGYTVTDRDENNNLYIEDALSSEKVDYIQKLATMLGDSTQNLDGEAYRDLSGTTEAVLHENRFLFATADLGDLKFMRDNDIEIGILPMPKKDASQSNYHSFSATGFVIAFYFSQNLKDEEMSGVITEAMAALSEKYVEPAYYEKALKGRSTYDIESRSMLDIIYSNEVVELADAYKWGDITLTIDEAILGDSDTIVSSYSSGVKVANRQIKSFMNKINKQNSN